MDNGRSPKLSTEELAAAARRQAAENKRLIAEGRKIVTQLRRAAASAREITGKDAERPDQQ
jgi:hypothetical protein